MLSMTKVSDHQIHVDMKEFSMCTVTKENGDVISIRSLWEKQPAIFVFLRHFACDACRQHAVEVWENREKYENKGARIHFIGNGTAHFLSIFKNTFGLQEASFFTDPTLRTFRAAGFKKGFWIDPGEMHSRPDFLYQAIRFGLRKENAGKGNVWQLGGVLAVRPGGIPTYQFTSLTMGHFPPVTDVPAIAKADGFK